jgi:hypothetical protein
MRYQTIEATVDLTLQEYLRCSFAVFFKSRRQIFLFFSIPVFLSVLLCHVVYTTVQSGSPLFVNKNLPILIYFLFLLIYPLIFVTTYFGAKKQMATNSYFKFPQKFVFSDAGIGVSNPSSSSHTDWSNIREVRETKTLFLLLSGTHHGFFIPKRCFQNQAAIPEFRALLAAELGAKAKLKA